jgi:hypothetical protein
MPLRHPQYQSSDDDNESAQDAAPRTNHARRVLSEDDSEGESSDAHRTDRRSRDMVRTAGGGVHR